MGRGCDLGAYEAAPYGGRNLRVSAQATLVNLEEVGDPSTLLRTGTPNPGRTGTPFCTIPFGAPLAVQPCCGN